MNTRITLHAIEPDGSPREYSGNLPEVTCDVLRATVENYRKGGFAEPWICYLALTDNTLVGMCGFKSPPRDGRVEIAYFTFGEHEGREVASAMAAALGERSVNCRG